MIFSPPCVQVTLLKRYKRFLADIQFENGEVSTAHCPNTGSMKTCYEPGDKILVCPATNPSRKLKWTWEMTHTPLGYIGVNTSRPNRLVVEAIQEGLIQKLCGYGDLRTEVGYGEQKSRIDILLANPGKCFIEVKNATLLDKKRNLILFPDAVTTRGQKHLSELILEAKKGHRAIIFFVVNRPDGKALSIAKDIDPVYAKLMKDALNQGVEIMAWRTQASPFHLSLSSEVQVDLNF